MRRAARDIVSALGMGLGVGFLVALVPAWRAATAGRYWEAGYLRLIADGVWDRFDRSAPIVAVVAVVVAGAALLLRRHFGPRLFRAGLAMLVLVGLLRALTALDAWRVASGPNVLQI